MTSATPSPPATVRPRALARWLLIVASVVFVMVVVGGITRLTESGLSMVRWEPISGVVPPLNEPQWQAEFQAYKATPEYRKINRGMSLDEFKSIFFWEYLHRQIGRLIGLAMILPLAWFAWRRAIPSGYGWRLTALTALVVLQGAIGWWMVASGLVDRPDVSHLRLATHLVTALIFFGGLIWTALDLLGHARNPEMQPARLHTLPAAALLILAIQITLGAFTAGLDAGFAFASWPLMGDRLFPEHGWNLHWNLIENLRDNPVVIQFMHRWWAWAAAAAAVLLAFKARSKWRAAPVVIVLLVGLQIALGIETLLSGVAIPIAAAHQAVAVLLLASLVLAAHRLGERA
jgi:cytochrome c oxidase assembly protein subunit 15